MPGRGSWPSRSRRDEARIGRNAAAPGGVASRRRGRRRPDRWGWRRSAPRSGDRAAAGQAGFPGLAWKAFAAWDRRRPGGASRSHGESALRRDTRPAAAPPAHGVRRPRSGRRAGSPHRGSGVERPILGADHEVAGGSHLHPALGAVPAASAPLADPVGARRPAAAVRRHPPRPRDASDRPLHARGPARHRARGVGARVRGDAGGHASVSPFPGARDGRERHRPLKMSGSVPRTSIQMFCISSSSAPSSMIRVRPTALP